jgi:hypothetical protein
MKAVFHGERNAAAHGSGLMGVSMQHTPPLDGGPVLPYQQPYDAASGSLPFGVTSWLEVWDYAGGASFRAFEASDGEEKSTFAFFDVGVIGRDLKQAYVEPIWGHFLTERIAH